MRGVQGGGGQCGVKDVLCRPALPSPAQLCLVVLCGALASLRSGCLRPGKALEQFLRLLCPAPPQALPGKPPAVPDSNQQETRGVRPGDLGYGCPQNYGCFWQLRK